MRLRVSRREITCGVRNSNETRCRQGCVSATVIGSKMLGDTSKLYRALFYLLSIYSHILSKLFIYQIEQRMIYKYRTYTSCAMYN